MIITQYSPAPRNKNDQKILNNIQIPILPNNPSDGDIYKYYGITREEQKIIESIVSYKKEIQIKEISSTSKRSKTKRRSNTKGKRRKKRRRSTKGKRK